MIPWHSLTFALIYFTMIQGQTPVTCPVGSYLSGSGYCKPCKVCASRTVIRQRCTQTRDTVCFPDQPRSTGPPKVCPQSKDDVHGNGSLCCSYCDVGYGVSQACDDGNDTRCERCKKGVEFSGTVDHTAACQPCSKCPENAKRVRPCNETADAVCECLDGFFMADTEQCLPCSRCTHGYGSLRKCTKSRDTICVPCPNGTFSDVISESCLVCSRCKDDQTMLLTCTSTKDTICVTNSLYERRKKIRINIDVSPGQSEGHRRREKIANHPAGGIDVIPIYCSLLGLVVIGLLIYVIVKHTRRVRAKRSGGNYRHPVDVESNSYQKSEAVFFSNPSQGFLSSKSPYHEVSLPRRKEIAKRLSKVKQSGGDWKKLAHELGYKKDKINQFASLGQSHEYSGAEMMLDDWLRREKSSLAKLVKALNRIRREDIVGLLYVDSITTELHPLKSTVVL